MVLLAWILKCRRLTAWNEKKPNSCNVFDYRKKGIEWHTCSWKMWSEVRLLHWKVPPPWLCQHSLSHGIIKLPHPAAHGAMKVQPHDLPLGQAWRGWNVWCYPNHLCHEHHLVPGHARVTVFRWNQVHHLMLWINCGTCIQRVQWVMQVPQVWERPVLF